MKIKSIIIVLNHFFFSPFKRIENQLKPQKCEHMFRFHSIRTLMANLSQRGIAQSFVVGWIRLIESGHGYTNFVAIKRANGQIMETPERIWAGME